MQGSELSPRTHYFVAGLFVKAGFPPGVVNFILHRPEDAPEVVGCLIRDPAVRKVNFTGSTQVGRSIAQQAGLALKPVLLELGGKNCCIVLKDADIDRAAEAALAGATLNVSLLSTTPGHSLINFVHKGRTDMHVYRSCPSGKGCRR